MIIREEYAREYLYDPGDMKTGLTFETNYPDGFTYGCQYQKSWKAASDWSIENLLKRAEVQFGFASEEATEYILQEFGKILRNEPSAWRINYVEPCPNQIRLELALKDEEDDNKTPDRELIDELLENALQVTIDICGDDLQEESRSGGLAKLALQCKDPHSPEEVSYISIHVIHDSKAECAWEKERAFIKVKQTDGNHSRSHSIVLRWKNKKRKRMIARIEEEYYL